MNGAVHHTEIDPMLARLKRLPARHRVAHLAALLRHERRARTHAQLYPSPCARERVAGRDDANDLGDARRRPESVGVGGVRKWPRTLAYALLRPSRERATLASDPTAARGEGSSADLATPTLTQDGRTE